MNRHLASIDVGSNAMRCAIGEIIDGKLVIVESIRCMVSLGRSVFNDRSRLIDKPTLQKSILAFKQFADLIAKYKVEQVRAVGTSALRDAENADELKDIAASFGIRLETISGSEEADLIRYAIEHKVDIPNDKTVGLFDIGGGSAELTIILNGQTAFSISERVGTIRLLKAINEQRIGSEKFTERVRKIINALAVRIENELEKHKLDLLIGTGGNIEELGKIRAKIIPNKKKTDKIKLPELEHIIEIMEPMSLLERESFFDIRPDRADVILPASIVLREVMIKAKINKVVIPSVGLKEGILVKQFIDLGEI
jgi:exopolyphosphatase/guanosine-5'-triphosphate,3'-diphosphate pyrophosphatase